MQRSCCAGAAAALMRVMSSVMKKAKVGDLRVREVSFTDQPDGLGVVS